MAESCAYRDSKQNCYLDQSLHSILFDWSMRNVHIPATTYGLVFGLVSVLFAWYFVNWLIRTIVSLLFPISILIAAFFIYPYYKSGRYEHVVEDAFSALETIITKVADVLAVILHQLTA